MAVKMLKEETAENDEVRFLQEAAINGQFQHRNVVKLHGVVTLGRPVSLGLPIHLEENFILKITYHVDPCIGYDSARALP